LARTRKNLGDTFELLLGSEQVDEEALDDLEAGLLAADMGPSLTTEVIGRIRDQARQQKMDIVGLKSALRGILGEILKGQEIEEPGSPERIGHSLPRVVLVVGVNGGGKTTTVGKLAAREQERGRKVMVVAADTFRAAAIDQLQKWTERSGVELVKHREGADPSAVVFDALQSANKRRLDTVLVDTAGRLHTKANLMAELGKLSRVSARVIPGAPHEVLLVVDATTGQNGLNQAREFTRAARLTGVVLTKLDGTAKGGVALGIRRQLGVPIQYVGVGEALDDLLDFDAEAFLEGLLGDNRGTA
jgi:fused signal recognition particle receptor